MASAAEPPKEPSGLEGEPGANAQGLGKPDDASAETIGLPDTGMKALSPLPESLTAPWRARHNEEQTDSADASSRRLPKERTIGPYKLISLLGRGGMSTVWEAVDTRLGRHVAIKLMRSGEDASPEELERFRRGARNSARLRHPNIVPVHDFGVEQGRDYLVMDLVDGGTLGEALRRRSFTYKEKALLLEKVARAVHYAHEQGVIHRDLKPNNIMLDFKPSGSSEPSPPRTTGVPPVPEESHERDARVTTGVPPETQPPIPNPQLPEPLVMDFDLAKVAGKDTRLSQSGQVMGTPAYMPPEQAEGRNREISPRSDIYSLGATLYEMLAGRAPFVGENAMQVLRATLYQDPVPPRQITPGVPRDLETMCLKCLEKKPEQRYPSAAALADDLRAFVNDDPISARPLSPAERGARRVRKNPAPYIVGALAAALLIASTALYIRSLDRKRREIEGAFAQYKEEQAAKEKSERERLALAAQKKREWQLVFEDDLSDPEKFAENWEVVSAGGQWELKDGELHVWGGAPQVAVLKTPVMGDVRFEFECRLEGDPLSDVTCVLAGTKARVREPHRADGYEFQYGGAANTSNSISRESVTIWLEKAAPLVKGQRYRACAENVGGHLRYTVNGQVLFDLTDKSPLSGPERAFAALEGYSSHTYWRNVKVYRLTEARSADLLEVAARQLERANAVAAEALYQEVLDSANDAVRGARAKEGLENARRLASLQYKLAEYQDRVRNAWPKGNAHLTARGLVVEISECGVKDLALLRGLPITELRCNANEITSLEPLRDMPLRVLDCGNNPIRSLEPLTGMKLARLTCRDNAISDLAPLAGMPLAELDCNGNKITTLEPLRGLPLTELRCDGNEITSLEPLVGMRLVSLFLAANSIRSLEPLRGMALANLGCDFNQITSLEPLRGMPLQRLYCSNNQIASLEPLRGADLYSLSCRFNQIGSLDPLRGVPLKNLHCGGNPLRSLAPFVDVPPDYFPFDCDTLTEQELQRLREVWSANARYVTHARMAAVILDCRRKNKAALLALSQDFRGRHYLLAPQQKPWQDALEVCQKVGGHLLTISDAEENRLAQRLAASNTVWIGLNRRNGKVAWVTGEPVLFDNCLPGWKLTDGPLALRFDGKWEGGSYGGSAGERGIEEPKAFIIEWDE